jgi:hypothetical protein
MVDQLGRAKIALGAVQRLFFDLVPARGGHSGLAIMFTQVLLTSFLTRMTAFADPKRPRFRFLKGRELTGLTPFTASHGRRS